MCSQIIHNMAGTVYTETVNKAKLYNEWQIKLLESSNEV